MRIATACHAASTSIQALATESEARLTALDHLPAALLREAFAGRL